MAINKSFKDLSHKEHQIENHIKPKAREELIKNHFESLGFKVVKLEEPHFNEETKKFNGMTLQIDEIEKLANGSEIFDAIRLNIDKRSLPDFVCEKGKKILFVEVKSEKFDPNDKNQLFRQRKTILELQKKGYDVEIWGVDIDGMLKNFHNLKENKKSSLTKWGLT